MHSSVISEFSSPEVCREGGFIEVGRGRQVWGGVGFSQERRLREETTVLLFLVAWGQDFDHMQDKQVGVIFNVPGYWEMFVLLTCGVKKYQ